MKRCPQCSRDYNDDSLKFCLDDGAELLFGPGRDEPATAVFAVPPTDDLPTQILTTSADTKVITDDSIGKSTASATTRPFDRRFILVAFALAAIAVAGFFGYRYFPTSTAGSTQLNSIAVLPFDNRSGSTESDYLADGLTDSLIFRFSQLPNLKVSPTSSVMRYKGKTDDIGQIAKDLGVDAVLSGRLSQLGDNLTISVELIDARTKNLVWKEQYDRKLADLLSTQREIAMTLTQKMQLNLAGDEKGIAKKYTSSNEAYTLYLKGRFHWAKRTRDDMFKAIDSYNQAIALDPNFALAFAAKAEVYNSIGKNPHAAPQDSIPLAKAAATRALEIDPMLPQAHSALGDSLALYDRNWKEAEEHLKRALELDPNIAYTHVVYGTTYLPAVGKGEEAAAELERALELEPASLISNSVAVSTYIYARQYDKALDQAKKAVELDPDFPLSKHWLGSAYIVKGQYDEAIRACKEPGHDPLSEWLCIVVVGNAEARLGRRAEAEQQIEKLRAIGKTQYIRPYYLATIYAALGEKDKAFQELERSFAERDCYLGRANVDPFMDPLRDDPRLKDLMKRMGLSD